VITGQQPELKDLVGQVKDLLLTSLERSVWLSRATMRDKIPDDLAEVLCHQTSPLTLEGIDDPKAFGKEKLVTLAIKLLKEEGLCHTDGPEGEEKLMLFYNPDNNTSGSLQDSCTPVDAIYCPQACCDGWPSS